MTEHQVAWWNGEHLTGHMDGCARVHTERQSARVLWIGLDGSLRLSGALDDWYDRPVELMPADPAPVPPLPLPPNPYEGLW